MIPCFELRLSGSTLFQHHHDEWMQRSCWRSSIKAPSETLSRSSKSISTRTPPSANADRSTLIETPKLLRAGTGPKFQRMTAPPYLSDILSRFEISEGVNALLLESSDKNAMFARCRFRDHISTARTSIRLRVKCGMHSKSNATQLLKRVVCHEMIIVPAIIPARDMTVS
jgi:hypothetical protein